MIEWYDFFAFASAAALVFDKVFFPKVATATGLLLSLMTYGVGFITRPLGGLIFGVLGDRYGRKPALVASLLLMGLCTFAVGLVPSYERIGVAAPSLLVVLRLLQGLAVGGEVGGAVLLVAETLSKERRGYWTAWPQIGGPAGNLIAALVFALLARGFSERDFNDYGWRVAFLLSGALIAVGVWMRSRVEESPLYRSYAATRDHRERTTLVAVLRRHWRAVLGVLCIKAGENALFYVFTTFFIVYVTRVLQLPRSTALGASSVASAAEVVTIFVSGLLDRFGRRPVTAIGLLSAAAWCFLLFPMCTGGRPLWIVAAAVVGGATASSLEACRRSSWNSFPRLRVTPASRQDTSSLVLWVPSPPSSEWLGSIALVLQCRSRCMPRNDATGTRLFVAPAGNCAELTCRADYCSTPVAT